MIADQTPISNVSLATKISFGQLFQIIPFNDSFLFCVCSCKHLLSKSSSLKLRKIGFIMSLTTMGSPAFLYTGLYHLFYQTGIYINFQGFLDTFGGDYLM